ncbi:hypothetical protein A6R68_06929, partial [Neotoma lepida]
LEEVMEKETYKTAKLILERFDPDSKKAKRFVSELQLKETFPQHQQALIRALLHKFQYLLGHQRMLQLLGDLQKGLLLQPYPGALDPLLLQCLEWCFSHNGMALKEEFEYIEKPDLKLHDFQSLVLKRGRQWKVQVQLVPCHQKVYPHQRASSVK